jgi:hypothetical protein
MVYAVQATRAGGLTVAEIAAKYNLPVPTVLQLLRAPSQSCALRTPYEFRQGALPARAPAQIYWLGYIAAAGRVSGENARGTLVLAIHPDDGAHVQSLLTDLIEGYANCEFVDSSLSGRQAYIRNPELARVLLQWGILSTPEQSSIPLEFVPTALMPDFLRGYIEGTPSRAATLAPRLRGQLTLTGAAPFIESLAATLKGLCGTGGTISTPGNNGMARLVYTARDSMRLLDFAYRSPVRHSPRAAALVTHFARRQAGRSASAVSRSAKRDDPQTTGSSS